MFHGKKQIAWLSFQNIQSTDTNNTLKNQPYSLWEGDEETSEDDDRAVEGKLQEQAREAFRQR